MGILGSILGGAVKPVADAAGRYGEAREERKARIAEARALIELAASSWRPWLARLLGVSIAVHVAGSLALLLMMAFGVTWARPWSLLATWALWMAYGRELFDLTVTLLGLYIGSRGLEKVAPVIGGPAGRAIGSVAGVVTGRNRTREPITTVRPSSVPPSGEGAGASPPVPPVGATIREAAPFMEPTRP